MCNLSPGLFYPSATGVFYILKTTVRCQKPWMRSTHTSTTKSNTSNPRFQNTTPLLYPPPQNCFKSPHNSINHFDNHFDAYPKYPSTNINNKLSDNYKIHPIPQDPTILRLSHTHKSRQLISKIFTNQATFHNNPPPSKCFDLSNSSENHLL